MSRASTFCLAALLAFWGVSDLAWAQGLQQAPVPIRVKQVDGKSVNGTISTWDATGCSGEFGRVEWANLKGTDANRILRKLVNEKDAAQMLLLGRALLSTEDGQKLGETALREAARLDGQQKDAVEAARAEGLEAGRKAAERRVRDALPQGRDGSTFESWPIATAEERAKALIDMKHDAEQALTGVRMRWTWVETDFWVVYADLNNREVRELGRRMDNMYRKVAEMMALPKDVNIFHGKGVCIVSGEERMFRAIEMSLFGSMPPPGCIGICHMMGPKVMVNAYRDPDDDHFMATLVHEATHGVMHRYGTAAQLPLWAEEGYAEFVAARSFDSSPVDAGRRPQGEQFIRSGNATLPLFQSDGRDGNWPGEGAVGYAIGYLTVSLMIDQKGSTFGEWVKDIKTGMPWEQALLKHFHMTPQQMSEAVERYYANRAAGTEAAP